MIRPASRIAVRAFIVIAGIVALSPAAFAQSNTGILKYNDKGEVTGGVETKGKRPRRPAEAPAGAKKQNQKGTQSQSVNGAGAEPGEITVFGPTASFERTMRADGYTLLERITLETLGLTAMRLRAPPNVSAEGAARAIETRFPSLSVGVNQRFKVIASPKGDYGRQVTGWGDVPAACGNGIRIGMIYTLVDTAHPAIQVQRITRRSFIPKGTNHGTTVAGLLIGKANCGDWKGLLAGASLCAANIFSARADGGLRANLGSMMKALDWLAQKKVHVVNFRLASLSNKVLWKLMERASKWDLALVAAACNGGATARPAYPAAHPLVLAVTAVDRNLALYNFDNQGEYIYFAAPGVALWTARESGGSQQSGTSFAAPFITPAVAIHLSNGVKPKSRTLRKQLQRFTKDLGVPGRDSIFGWGLVRIRPNC